MAQPPRDVFEQPAAATVAHDEPPADYRPFQEDRSFFGHPRGLATLFFTELWERFSYYGIRPLLVLFMTAAIGTGGFGFPRETATSIVGIYAACVYLGALPGGWIADRLLGLQRAIWYGGVLIALGHLSIAFSLVFAQHAFFLGLVLIVLGTGLLKPNVSAIVGDLYPQGGSVRDAGFSVFYMGINAGALIAPVVTGFLGERVGWHLGFGAAGIGMLIGLVTYRIRAPRTLGPLGLRPTAGEAEQRRVRNIVIGAVVVIALLIVLAMTGLLRIDPVAIAQNMTAAILAMALLYFAYLLFFAGLTADEKRRVVVILALFIFATVFWSAFEQAPTSLNLFSRDFTDRHILGWEAPASWLQSAEPAFVIIFAPVFAWLWVRLARSGFDFSSPTKFAVGLAFAGVSFLVMLAASHVVIAGGAGVRVSMFWLVGCYLLQAFGELSLSPVGLSSMTKLAPRKFVGQMMGIWFMADALGNLIAGLVGGNVNPEKLAEMPILFGRTALALFAAAAIAALLVVPIRRMMRERA